MQSILQAVHSPGWHPFGIVFFLEDVNGRSLEVVQLVLLFQSLLDNVDGPTDLPDFLDLGLLHDLPDFVEFLLERPVGGDFGLECVFEPALAVVPAVALHELQLGRNKAARDVPEPTPDVGDVLCEELFVDVLQPPVEGLALVSCTEAVAEHQGLDYLEGRL